MEIRHLDNILLEHVQKKREVLVLMGSRQVGKTTILKRLFPQAQYFTCDVEPTVKMLESFDPAVYRQFIARDTKILILDEIHLLSNPGRAVKIYYDLIPEIKLLVTGSSAIDIKNKAGESLAGRKIDRKLYPLTLSEYLVQKNVAKRLFFPYFEREKEFLEPFDQRAIMDNLMVYGLYPALLDRPEDKDYLKNLAESVVIKDLLNLSLIENRNAALTLLKLLAYQIGSLVNYSELSLKTGLDLKTVKRYITLFQECFIIFTLLPYSKRKGIELVKAPKIYFYDLGLRNALIDNFELVDLRPDAGHMWENFVVSEILKANYYGDYGYSLNYWRTTQGSEIDLVISKGDDLAGLEIKSRSGRMNMAFKNRYPSAKMEVVTKENFLF